MTSFAQTLSPTPFGVFDSGPAFQTEADAMVVFVKRMLGDDEISVELTKKQIWACFEQAVLEFGAIVNQYQAISQIHNFLGLPTGTMDGAQKSFPPQTLEYLMKQAEPYGVYAQLGGNYLTTSGSITLEPGVQDYDLQTDLVDDTTGVPLSTGFASGTTMRIGEVFHFSPSAAFRFFDSTSAINYMNNEFGFESFTPETIFYVLPVFEDILRAGQMDVSQRVRRSNYSWKVIGHKLRIYPTPQVNITGSSMKLWVRVYLPIDADALAAQAAGSGSFPVNVSSIANAPYGILLYDDINAGIARQWIRQFTLALCKEVLGRVRRKVQTIPIPGHELTLDGDSLLTEGREDQNRIRESFTEILDAMTSDKIAEREAGKSENMLKQLRNIPMPNGYSIIVG